MAKGSSKGGGAGGALAKQAAENMKGVNGYTVILSDGRKMDYFFQVNDDGKLYQSTNLYYIPEPVPYGYNEAQMMANIERFGGQVTKYSKKQLIDMETARLKDRQETNAFLNQHYARNRGADVGAKAYRNTRKANRIAKRR